MFTVRVDTTSITGALDAMGEKQIAFASSKGLNDAAKLAQQAIRAGIQQRFTIRRPWVLQLVKIQFSSKKTDAYAVVIYLDPEHDLLEKFEAGGTKTPHDGGRALAVPVDVRRNKMDVIMAANRPRAFSFSRGRVGVQSRVEVYEGARRAFMVRQPDGSGYILKRTGKGQHGSLFTGTEVLYRLKPSVPIPASLLFGKTGVAAVQEAFPQTFAEAWRKALATARP